MENNMKDSKNTNSLFKEFSKEGYENYRVHGSQFLYDDLYVPEELSRVFELTFLRKITEKCLLWYLNKYGYKKQTLFRRDDALDDLIKYQFFTFGHVFLKPIYVEMKLVLDKKDLVTNTKHIYNFWIKMNQIIDKQLPKVLQVLIKVLYEKLIEIFKFDKDEAYEPILTVLFFNFIFNPRILEMNAIQINSNENAMKLINVVSKLIYNNTFSEKDKFYKYNAIIPDLFKNSKKVISKHICSFEHFNDEQLHKYLTLDIYDQNKSLVLPDWLFNFDADMVIRIFDESHQIKFGNKKVEPRKTRAKSSKIFLIFRRRI